MPVCWLVAVALPLPLAGPLPLLPLEVLPLPPVLPAVVVAVELLAAPELEPELAVTGVSSAACLSSLVVLGFSFFRGSDLLSSMLLLLLLDESFGVPLNS